MTAPTLPDSDTKPAVPWWVRPRVVLPVLITIVTISALLTGEPSTPRGGDPRLSTHSTKPLGAKLFYDLARRLGWQVRRESNDVAPHDSTTVFAVLDPTIPLRAVNAHQVLEHVRSGGAALIVLGKGTRALSDSLELRPSLAGGNVESRLGAIRECATTAGAKPDFRDILTAQSTSLWFGPASLLTLEGTIPSGSNSETFVFARKDSSYGKNSSSRSAPAVIGFALGRGRIVVSADPDVLRNDALRECRYGLDVAMVRALAFLRGGSITPRNTIVFDEYHLDNAASGTVWGPIRQYLAQTPSGHVVLQLAAAALVLLLAAAVRTLPARDDPRIERRSPLEHVDALARAYSQVGATRTAVLRLVRGLRRRTDYRAARNATADQDETFFTRIVETKPALAADIALVRGALDKGVKDKEFTEVGNAVARIEAALTRT